MKRQIFARWTLGVAALVAAVALTGACGGSDDDASSDSSARLRVVATTVQIEALAREVGGELIDLHGIVPAGADAHEFEPTASDLAAIEDADVILRHGIELDEWLDDTLSAGRDAAVSVVTSGISLQRGEAEHHGDEEDEDGHDDGDEDAADPHVWLDPDNAKIMVRSIAAALAAADPANRETYDANSTAYQATLDETRGQVQAIIDEIPAANRKLVTNHDAFGYFARAFGLDVVGAVIPSISTEAEPSAAETAALLDTIEAEGVKAIFAESSVNPDLARTLASDAGIAIVDDLYGDSLGEAGSGAETVHGMLLFNARKIAEALK
jgi:ABC-type Zn uptake system ZnuABC Zn-binding protein ZnuA